MYSPVRGFEYDFSADKLRHSVRIKAPKIGCLDGADNWGRHIDLMRWLRAGLALSFWISYRTFWENTFLAPVVKIQKERGHKVVSTGPYAVVRHPLYSAVLIMLPSTALMLGSWYGLAASFLISGAIIFRTVMEDRKLTRELDGYADYAARVRYRLVPLVW